MIENTNVTVKPSRKCKTNYRSRIPPLESFKEHGTIFTASPKAIAWIESLDLEL